jgi:hypothetical protein
MYVLFATRFSILDPNAGKHWQLARTVGDMDAYRDVLFDDLRLEVKFACFERLTVPSMASQKLTRQQRMRWLVFASPQLPEPYRLRLLAAVGKVRSALVVWVDSVEEFDSHVDAEVWRLRETGVPFATVRLDDDDGLAANYCATLAGYAHLNPGEIVSFVSGRHVGVRLIEGNTAAAFALGKVVYAPYNAFGTAMIGGNVYRAGNHRRLAERFVVHLDQTPEMWLAACSHLTDSQRGAKGVNINDTFAVSLIGDTKHKWRVGSDADDMAERSEADILARIEQQIIESAAGMALEGEEYEANEAEEIEAEANEAEHGAGVDAETAAEKLSVAGSGSCAPEEPTADAEAPVPTASGAATEPQEMPGQPQQISEADTEMPEQQDQIPEADSGIPEQTGRAPEIGEGMPVQPGRIHEADSGIPEQPDGIPEPDPGIPLRPDTPAQTTTAAEADPGIHAQTGQTLETAVEMPGQTGQIPEADSGIHAQTGRAVEADVQMHEQTAPIPDADPGIHAQTGQTLETAVEMPGQTERMPDADEDVVNCFFAEDETDLGDATTDADEIVEVTDAGQLDDDDDVLKEWLSGEGMSATSLGFIQSVRDQHHLRARADVIEQQSRSRLERLDPAVRNLIGESQQASRPAAPTTVIPARPVVPARPVLPAPPVIPSRPVIPAQVLVTRPPPPPAPTGTAALFRKAASASGEPRLAPSTALPAPTRPPTAAISPGLARHISAQLAKRIRRTGPAHRIARA